MRHQLALFLVLCLLLSACQDSGAPATATDQPEAKQQDSQPTRTFAPEPSVTSQPDPSLTPGVTPSGIPVQPVFNSPLPTQVPTLAPGAWMELPVLPQMSLRAREIYQRGLELGNNPQAFAKIGDCGSTPAWFLGDFDLGPRYYELGEYSNLQAVIQAFQGSYSRTSLAAKSGFNASSIFSPLWSNRQLCDANETPLACEYRVLRPSFAFIMLGTNDVWHQDSFEAQMRKIIEYSIERGILPILSTKADNAEGDGSINATIASLALEYQLPLWNYWKAVQPLPHHGLQEDGAHITWAPNRFDDPEAMRAGWPVRNLTALQVLDTVWRYVTVEE